MPIPRDYRTIDNPRLSMRQVIIYINNDMPKFSSKDIERKFNIHIAEACTKIAFLKKYGCVRIVEKGKPRIYEITDWGKKMAKKWEKEYDKAKS